MGGRCSERQRVEVVATFWQLAAKKEEPCYSKALSRLLPVMDIAL